MPIEPQAAEQARDQLLQAYEEESRTTLKVFKAIPETKLTFKPHERSMGMGELTWHIVTTECWFIGGLLKGVFDQTATPSDVPKEPPHSMAGIVSAYERLTAARIAELKLAKGAALAREVKFFDRVLPAVQFLQLNLNHTIHHRGQLSVYLRLAGIKVPSIYGPSADDNPFEN